MKAGKQSRWCWGLTIFLAALLVRLAALWVWFPKGGWSEVGYGSELGQIAANLAAGRGFSSPFCDGSQPTAWVAPLTPVLWAAVFKVAGVFSHASLVCIGVLQCVASAGSCWFYYLILWRLLSTGGKNRRYWILGGMVLLIFWPLCLKAITTFWYFAWQECALAGMFWAAIVWLDRRTWQGAMLLGLCAGWVALINPVPLVLFAGIAIAAWRVNENGAEDALRLRSANAARRVNSFVQLGLSLTVAFLMIGPWMLRNAMAFHALIPSRSCFGIALWQGNNPAGAIVQTADSMHPALNEQERGKFLKMGEYAYDQAALRSARDYIKCNPVKTAQRTLQRIYVFWCSDIRGDWPWKRQSELHRGAWWMLAKGVKTLPWVVSTLVLAWVMVSGRMQKVPYWALFLALFALYPLSFYATTVSPMYAYLVHSYMLIMAVTGMGLSGSGRDAKGEAQSGER